MTLLEWVGVVAHAVFETAGDPPPRSSIEMLSAAPLPLAVFRSASHALIASSPAWRAMFGGQGEATRELIEALDRADSSRVMYVVPELTFHHADDPMTIERACSVVIQPVALARDAHALIAACVDITDEVTARRLEVPAKALIWSGRGSVVDYANTSWHQYVGSDAVDWQAHLMTDDLGHCHRAQSTAAQNRQPAECEARLRRSDGAHRWHQVRFCCTDSGANPRWYATAIDIEDTEHANKQRIALLDRLLVALNEAESANRAKDNFLATVSHELRAPVTTIMLWENVLRDHLDDAVLRVRALDAIRESAGAQARLVGDLLDISRAISGKLRLERRRMAIEGVLSAAVEAALPAATAKHIALEISSKPRLGRVLADPARLRQVFDNLLSNAVKFTPAGGRIVVTAERSRGGIAISVTDTGCGIEEGLLRRLFTPFVRHEDVLTRSEAGLGLGLAITKQLVDLHDGTLTASSLGRDRGSTFTVTLPLAQRRTSTPVPATPELARLDGVHVLLVDDEPRVREGLTLLLSRVGASVAAASSAAEARDMLARGRPDVLLCDISMPSEDGYAFLRGLRSSPQPAHDVPAIALTAYASERDRERAAAAGFDAHLAKPVQLQNLAAAIAELLSARSELA